jgi:xylulokinase
MTALLGIDLGTSSVKAVVIDESARVLSVASHEYPILTPHPGWAEQDPQAWWKSTVLAVRQAVTEAAVPIAGIGLSGQMHGFVMVDSAAQPLGNVIMWADQRSVTEVDEIFARVGRDRLATIAGTAPATGFMAATLLWLLKHDPARLDRTAACLLPKDYIRLRLTGNIAAEVTDASATALFDVRQRTWSTEIVDVLGLPGRILPQVIESSELAGTLVPDAADALGLKAGIPVVAGCADQVAQAIGNQLLNPGNGSVTLGSGGQVFVPLDRPMIDANLSLHNFCHAPTDRWYLLGAMLAAGLSLRWLRDTLGLKDDPNAYPYLASLAAEVPPGADGLFFLPYMAGERSPLMDPLARGCFIGLTLRHERGHLARAIMEGVAFALRQIVETMIGAGAPVNRLLAAGNGLASPIWRQIVVDVLARPLYMSSGRERTGVGTALLAGIGADIYADYAQTQQLVAENLSVTEADTSRARFYEEKYQQFISLYPLLKPVFPHLNNG